MNTSHLTAPSFTTFATPPTNDYHQAITTKPGCFGPEEKGYLNNLRVPFSIGEIVLGNASKIVNFYLVPFKMTGDGRSAGPKSNQDLPGFEVIKKINAFTSFLLNLRNYANDCEPVYEYSTSSSGVANVGFYEGCSSKRDSMATTFNNVFSSPKGTLKNINWDFCTSNDERIFLSVRRPYAGQTPGFLNLRECATEKPIEGFFLGLTCPSNNDCFLDATKFKPKVLKRELQEYAAVLIKHYAEKKCEVSKHFKDVTTTQSSNSSAVSRNVAAVALPALLALSLV